MKFPILLTAFVACAVGDILFVATRSSLYRGRNSGLTLYMTLAAHELLLVLQFVCLVVLLARTYWLSAGMARELLSTVKLTAPLLLVKGFLTAFPAVYRDVLLPRRRGLTPATGVVVTAPPGSGSPSLRYAVRGWRDAGYGVLVVLDLLVALLYVLSAFHTLFVLTEKTLYAPYHVKTRGGHDRHGGVASRRGNSDSDGAGGGGGGSDSFPLAASAVAARGASMSLGGTGGEASTTAAAANRSLLWTSQAWLGGGDDGVGRSGSHAGGLWRRESADGGGASLQDNLSSPAAAPLRREDGKGLGRGAEQRHRSVGFDLSSAPRAHSPPPPLQRPPSPATRPAAVSAGAQGEGRAASDPARAPQQSRGRVSPSPSPPEATAAASSPRVEPVTPLELPHKFTTSDTEYPSYLNIFAAALLHSGFDSQNSTGTMMGPAAAMAAAVELSDSAHAPHRRASSMATTAGAAAPSAAAAAAADSSSSSATAAAAAGRSGSGSRRESSGGGSGALKSSGSNNQSTQRSSVGSEGQRWRRPSLPSNTAVQPSQAARRPSPPPVVPHAPAGRAFLVDPATGQVVPAGTLAAQQQTQSQLQPPPRAPDSPSRLLPFNPLRM